MDLMDMLIDGGSLRMCVCISRIPRPRQAGGLFFLFLRVWCGVDRFDERNGKESKTNLSG